MGYNHLQIDGISVVDDLELEKQIISRLAIGDITIVEANELLTEVNDRNRKREEKEKEWRKA